MQNDNLIDDKRRCWWANTSALMQRYHDEEWNVLVDDDFRFLEFLSIEIMQAGLSFETVMQKRNALNDAFDNFNPNSVALYDSNKIDSLMKNSQIIRNRKKIGSIIYNARAFSKIISEYGSFLSWFSKNGAESLEGNIMLFRKRFRFIGPKIVREFLESSGLMEKEHDESCFMKKQ